MAPSRASAARRPAPAGPGEAGCATGGFRIARTYEERAASPASTRRVLIDAQWPRGIKKEEFAYDVREAGWGAAGASRHAPGACLAYTRVAAPPRVMAPHPRDPHPRS
jgi:hypothetical protein